MGSTSNPYLPTPRGPTSRSLLAIDWDHAVVREPTSGEAGRTVAVMQRQALPLERAFAALAGDDPRPLLVLRECLSCTGTDDALLTRQADNERTMVMSQWFHCVKLPPDVLEADHPFHALFDGESGESPGHLFLAAADGRRRRDLNGQQSRTELWGLMEDQLAAHYAEKASPKVKALLRLLDDLDEVDGEIRDTEIRIDEEVESDRIDERKLAKLRRELADLEGEREDLRDEVARVSALAPKRPKGPEPAPSGT